MNKEIKRERRRFNPADIDAIADLVAKRHTETGACAILGLNYDSWRGFKSKGKNEARFAHSFTRMRALQLKAHTENIEAAESVDWRASKALIEMKFPELRPDASQSAPASLIAITAMHETLKRIFSEPQKAIVDVLPLETTQDAEIESKSLKSNPGDNETMPKVVIPTRKR